FAGSFIHPLLILLLLPILEIFLTQFNWSLALFSVNDSVKYKHPPLRLRPTALDKGHGKDVFLRCRCLCAAPARDFEQTPTPASRHLCGGTPLDHQIPVDPPGGQAIWPPTDRPLAASFELRPRSHRFVAASQPRPPGPPVRGSAHLAGTGRYTLSPQGQGRRRHGLALRCPGVG